MKYIKKNLLVLACAVIVQTQAQVQTLEPVTNLPAFYIVTDDARPVLDKTTWVPGHITVVSSDPSENFDMDLDIRGRGNTTWAMDKKPFRIKLNSKSRLLNLPAKQKNWVLLANHADKTLMLNALGFKISELLGFEYTPPTRFVDVFLNGEYLGNYHVTDQIEVASGRVPVEEQAATDTVLPDLSGGYLVEIDGYASNTTEPVWFPTTQGMKVTVKYPKDDEINAQQLDYITNIIQTFEDSLFSENFTDPETGYRSLIDTVSLINWYIASELTGNPDCFWSTYIYKKRNDPKIRIGPLWDMDIAFSNGASGRANILMRDHAFEPRTWMKRLWQDPWFREASSRRWVEFMENVQLEDVLLHFIDSLSTLLDASQRENFTKWDIEEAVLWEYNLYPTYEEGVESLRLYISQHIAFLSANFGTPSPPPPPPPPPPSEFFTLENYYYRIVSRGSGNAVSVQNHSLAPNVILQMWPPVEDDSSQLWHIIPLPNYEYQLLNLRSGQAMKGNGRYYYLTQTSPDTGNAAQRWNIIPVVNDSLYGLVNVKTNLSVNNTGNSPASGNPLIEYDNGITYEGSVNQHWYLEKAVEIPTGNAAVRNGNKTRIYPNPATAYVCIEQNGAGNADLLPVSIFNIDGNLLYSGNLKANASGVFEITLSSISIRPGIYILKTGDDYNKLIISR